MIDFGLECDLWLELRRPAHLKPHVGSARSQCSRGSRQEALCGHMRAPLIWRRLAVRRCTQRDYLAAAISSIQARPDADRHACFARRVGGWRCGKRDGPILRRSLLLQRRL